ncbi:MAG TPA: hypothetical protein VJ916_01410 [Anaerovoracaceae bacterium]|nr:hypothetical protein [Anaerovoracaceae bacterium]
MSLQNKMTSKNYVESQPYCEKAFIKRSLLDNSIIILNGISGSGKSEYLKYLNDKLLTWFSYEYVGLINITGKASGAYLKELVVNHHLSNFDLYDNLIGLGDSNIKFNRIITDPIKKGNKALILDHVGAKLNELLYIINNVFIPLTTAGWKVICSVSHNNITQIEKIDDLLVIPFNNIEESVAEKIFYKNFNYRKDDKQRVWNKYSAYLNKVSGYLPFVIVLFANHLNQLINVNKGKLPNPLPDIESEGSNQGYLWNIRDHLSDYTSSKGTDHKNRRLREWLRLMTSQYQFKEVHYLLALLPSGEYKLSDVAEIISPKKKTENVVTRLEIYNNIIDNEYCLERYYNNQKKANFFKLHNIYREFLAVEHKLWTNGSHQSLKSRILKYYRKKIAVNLSSPASEKSVGSTIFEANFFLKKYIENKNGINKEFKILCHYLLEYGKQEGIYILFNYLYTELFKSYKKDNFSSLNFKYKISLSHKVLTKYVYNQDDSINLLSDIRNHLLDIKNYLSDIKSKEDKYIFKMYGRFIKLKSTVHKKELSNKSASRKKAIEVIDDGIEAINNLEFNQDLKDDVILKLYYQQNVIIRDAIKIENNEFQIINLVNKLIYTGNLLSNRTSEMKNLLLIKGKYLNAHAVSLYYCYKYASPQNFQYLKKAYEIIVDAYEAKENHYKKYVHKMGRTPRGYKSLALCLLDLSKIITEIKINKLQFEVQKNHDPSKVVDEALQQYKDFTDYSNKINSSKLLKYYLWNIRIKAFFGSNNHVKKSLQSLDLYLEGQNVNFYKERIEKFLLNSLNRDEIVISTETEKEIKEYIKKLV